MARPWDRVLRRLAARVARTPTGYRLRTVLAVHALEDRVVPAGGVAVAAADLDGDGAADLVLGAGAGGGPHVRVVSGRTGADLASFYAYDPGVTAGVTVAAGDVTGDGWADILTAPGPGGAAHVKVFDGRTFAETLSVFAFDSTSRAGASVAAGDTDGDGRAEVIVGALDGPAVVALNGLTGARVAAFDTGFAAGGWVAAGDTDRDGRADVIAGAAGGVPRVRVLSGATGAERLTFLAYDPAFGGGVRVAAGDRNGDGAPDILTAPGAGGGPHVRAFDGATGAPLAAGSFFAYAADFRGGAFVAAADADGDGTADVVTGAGAGGAHVRVFGGRGADFFAFGPAAAPAPFTDRLDDPPADPPFDPAPENEAPRIDDVADLGATLGTALAPLAFAVSDRETPAGDLVVTAASDNPAVVPNAGIRLGGVGGSRTIELVPVTAGAATITLTVRDAGGKTATDTFRLAFTAWPAPARPGVSVTRLATRHRYPRASQVPGGSRPRNTPGIGPTRPRARSAHRPRASW